MSSAPYFKLYFSDLAGDTLHLSDAEMGSYMLLLGAMWNAGGALRNEPRSLARIARVTPARWSKRWAALAPFFVEEGGEITHHRIKTARKKVDQISLMRSEIGASGARAKSLKKQDEAQANASQDASNSEHKPESIDHSKRKKDKPSSSAGRPAASKASRRKPSVAIPDGFPTAEVIAEQQAKARGQGADIDAAYQAERFRNWAIGRDQRFADWTAAFRNWIAKAIADAPRKPSAAGSGAQAAAWPGPAEVRDAVRRSLEKPAYADSYLNHCAADPQAHVLSTENNFVADVLRKQCGRALSAVGWKVLVRGRAA